MGKIKFRAWDKKDKKMILPKEEWGYITFKGKVFEQGANHSYDMTKTVELMQYAGLEDKHGREIFEGDILRLNSKTIIEVIFHKGSFMVVNPKKLNNNPIELHHYAWKAGGLGNIYENKELLK